MFERSFYRTHEYNRRYCQKIKIPFVIATQKNINYVKLNANY